MQMCFLDMRDRSQETQSRFLASTTRMELPLICSEVFSMPTGFNQIYFCKYVLSCYVDATNTNVYTHCHPFLQNIYVRCSIQSQPKDPSYCTLFQKEWKQLKRDEQTPTHFTKKYRGLKACCFFNNFVKIYLFIFRERGREGEKHQLGASCTLVHTPIGTKPTTQARVLTGNGTGDPSLPWRDDAQPTEPPSQSKTCCF